MFHLKAKFFISRLYLWSVDRPKQTEIDSEKVTFHQLERHDIDIIAAAHRDRDLIEKRINAGFWAYWLEIDKKCVHIHWYATQEFLVWDIRCTVRIPTGSYFVFDVYTDPQYRKQGLLGQALAESTSRECKAPENTIFILTQASNTAANSAFSRLGFGKAADVKLTQIPPIRIYQLQKFSINQIRLKLMGIRNTPVLFDLKTVQFLR